MKKESLKEKIFNSAWEIVSQQGMQELSVRSIAKKSGCSLGSIYNAYESFQMLQVHINAKVLSMLLLDVLGREAQKGIEDRETLKGILRRLGMVYIEFGHKNKFLWKALFESYPIDPLPKWYEELTQKGVNQLCERLANYLNKPIDELSQLVGFFWSSIHGLSAILLNRKMEMVAELISKDRIPEYVEYCLKGLIEE